MDAALINPFINATIKVLATMAQAEVEAGKPYLKKPPVFTLKTALASLS